MENKSHHQGAEFSDPESTRNKTLKDISDHVQDIQKQIEIEFFLYNSAAYNLHVSDYILKGRENQLKNLNTPLSDFRPLLGLYNGELIQGGRGELHNYIRERIGQRDFGPNAPRITDISGFSMKHTEYPDVPIIIFNRDFTPEEQTTFAPLFENLKKQQAIVINEQVEEIPLP